MADLFPSVPVYLRPALERAIAAIPGSWLLQLMGLWTSDLANANSFTDSAYSVNITSFKLRKPVKLFHVPFFNLGSGFMGSLLNS
jgi:hypothetical protein